MLVYYSWNGREHVIILASGIDELFLLNLITVHGLSKHTQTNSSNDLRSEALNYVWHAFRIYFDRRPWTRAIKPWTAYADNKYLHRILCDEVNEEIINMKFPNDESEHLPTHAVLRLIFGKVHGKVYRSESTRSDGEFVSFALKKIWNFMYFSSPKDSNDTHTPPNTFPSKIFREHFFHVVMNYISFERFCTERNLC